MTDYMHERYSMQVLHYLLDAVALDRKGLCIEIGVGKKDFYSELFARLGFDTYAIDPILSPQFEAVLKTEKRIKFIKGVMADEVGKIVVLNRGRCNNDDLASIDPQWWANDTAKDTIILYATTVPSTFVNAKITCLKIDVEGSEWAIVSTLGDLKAMNLPRLLQFEFGGDTPKSSGQNGWAPYLQEQLTKSLAACLDLGYVDYIIIPSDVSLSVSGKLEPRPDPLSIFPDEAVFGNIILVHASCAAQANLSVAALLAKFA